MKRIILIGLATVALAGCGSGGGSGSSSNGSGSSSSNAAAGSTPTLYTFSKDTTNKSNCSGACAKNWPPATSAPAISGKVTTIKRSDGTTQVALHGHPLYRFSGDTNPGDANGDGQTAFGGLWKTATPVAKSSQSKPSSSYGY